MFCTKCGKEIAEDAIFCPYCGTQDPLRKDAASTAVAPAADNSGYAPTPGFVQPPVQPGTPAPKNSKGLLVGIIIAAVAIIAALLIVLIPRLSNDSGEKDTTVTDAPSSSENTSDEVTSDKVSEPDTSEISNYVEDPENITDNEASSAFRALLAKARQLYDAGKMTGLRELCVFDENDSSENSFNTFQEFLETIKTNNYPSENEYYEMILRSGYHFCGFFYTSLTTGNEPDTRTLMYYQTVSYSYLDGEWKFDFTQSALDSLNNNYNSLFANERDFLLAKSEGRNASIFGGNDYSWLSDSIITPGAINSSLYLLWQNADGSVSGMYVIKNGTDAIKLVSSIRIKISDEELGTVFEEYIPTSIGINPGTPYKGYFTIPAEKIKTKTDFWGSLRSSMDITY